MSDGLIVGAVYTERQVRDMFPGAMFIGWDRDEEEITMEPMSIETLTRPSVGDQVTLRHPDGTFNHVVVLHADEYRVLVAEDYDDPGLALSIEDFERLAYRTASNHPDVFWVEVVEYRPGEWAVNRHSLRPDRVDGEAYIPQSRRPDARWVKVQVIDSVG